MPDIFSLLVKLNGTNLLFFPKKNVTLVNVCILNKETVMSTSPTNEKGDNLIKRIEFLRKEMIRVDIQEGLTSEKTLIISRKLDIFIAKYQAQKNQKY